MLMALFFVILVFTFMAQDYLEIMPPFLMMVGGLMVLGGMVVKEPLLITGGIVLFGISLMYSEVVVK